MKLSKSMLIFAKEMRDIFRDKRTLFLMIVLPVILYPLLLIGLTQATTIHRASVQAKKARLVILGKDNAPLLYEKIASDDKFKILELPVENLSDPEKLFSKITDETVDVITLFEKDFAQKFDNQQTGTIVIYYDQTIDESAAAKNKLSAMLQGISSTQFNQRVISLDKDKFSDEETLKGFLHPINLETKNIAPPQKETGLLLSRILIFIIISLLLSNAFYPSIDITAGEKERGTLETLLSSPVSRSEIVFGKYLSVLVVTLVTALLNLLSLGLTLWHLGYLFESAQKVTESVQGKVVSFAIYGNSLFWILLIMIPLASFFSALAIGISSFARSVKEAQYYLLPLFIVVLPLAMVSSVPGFDLTYTMCLIPISGPALLAKDVMMGIFQWDKFILTVGMSVLYSAGALIWATSLYKKEGVLFREAQQVRFKFWLKEHADYPSAKSAISVLIICILLLWFVGSILQLAGTIPGVLTTEFGIIFLVPFLAIFLSKLNLRKTLFLYRPKLSSAGIAVILGIMAQPIAQKITEVLFLIVPQAQSQAQEVQKLITPLLHYNIAIPILVFALSAAICEEVLTRGYLLSAFKARYGTRMAIVLSALAFGILHLNIFQLPYAFFLGLIAGYLVVRTNSILPAMVFHFTNNAFALVSAKYKLIENILQYVNEHYRWLANISESTYLPWYIYVPAFIITFLCLYFIRHSTKSLDKGS